ncbi:branched-chain amino acid ABC transporter permease [Bosea lathyri]|uniref:Amino acid/amide ABC transporter membrane protein 2, HAAT family (TC 3.A.1.4.-) n=1 Tax=Bosea lathyri TaxID=1036778 RepID=A0A1H5UTX0_9HYPH|nr:branched-chain amino acid ABC transporter permease [Bosea lathyri]SEF78489.1 amino acid/amide ABC transporter membrane protein 2, HAAT family (TC 3.A.1.4.-) [Bosea lathyri]
MTSVVDKAAPAKRPAMPGTARILGFAALALALGVAMPWLVSSKLTLSLTTQAIVDALLATSVGFLVLQNGRVSFGQAAFFGLGGYAFGVLVARQLVAPELALLLALALPTLVAFLLGLVFARIAGVAHAMLTLAVGQAFYEIAFRWRELAKGDDGMSFDLPPRIFGFASSSLQDPAVMVVVAWSALVLALAGLALFVNSRIGQIAAAVRDNEERARFIGHDTAIPPAVVYAIAAFLAALAGVLQATYNGYIAPQMFHWSLSGTALIMAVVGGAQFIVGPAIGAVCFFFLKDFAGRFAEFWPAIVGTVLVAVTLLMPQGMVGLAFRLWAARRSKP